MVAKSLDTSEIVINWDDGKNVRIELVPIAALSKITKEMQVPDVIAIMAEMEFLASKRRK